MPRIADDTGVELDTAALLLSCLFAGSITTSALVAAAGHRLNPRLVAAAGLVVAGSALVALGLVGAWWMAIVAALVLGLGDGLIVAGTHELVAAAADDVASGINRLNLFFAFGAIAGPAWAGIVLASGGGRPLIYLPTAAVVMVAAAITLRSPLPIGHTRHEEVRSVEQIAATRIAPLAVLGLLLFLYVGAEFGLGSWVATYAERAADAGILAGALVTSAYWAALAFGRFASGRLFDRRWTAERVLFFSLLGGLALSIFLTAAGSIFVLGFIGAFGTGFFFGPVWPAVLAAATRGRSCGTPALMATVGNAGGVVIPWAQGRILVDAGPRQGIALTAVLCIVMLSLALLSHARTKPRST